MPEPRVILDPAMAPHFQLKAWDALDDGARLALGDHLSERLQAHGWEVSEPLTLGRFGPPGEERSVLQWREPTSGMVFSLIPGGSFRPGYTRAQLGRLKRLLIQDGWEEDEDEDDSIGLASLARKPPVRVSPSFLAAELVRPNLPGLRSVVALPEDVAEGQWIAEYDFMGDAVEFSWDQVGPVLEHYGWSLPTSAEFEWALRGGIDSLFYWGDDLPAFVDDQDNAWASSRGGAPPGPKTPTQESFEATLSANFDDPERPRTWPWCNRFGLAAMLPRETWCAPSDGADGRPLVIRGGAAHLFPWQGGCFEWTLLLNAMETRPATEQDPAEFLSISPQGAIRPTIRLAVGR